MSGPSRTVKVSRGRELPIDVLLRPFRAAAGMSTASGLMLLAAAVAALVWANSPLGHGYHWLWHEVMLTVGVGGGSMSHPLEWWVNDLLMAVFFLLVGLEIKRELVVGELASVRRAVTPAMAALGGMLVPAGIYAWFNSAGPHSSGWGVPMATDIAFALAVLSVLGRKSTLSMRVFLTSLAIIDDLGALVVIAVFYTESINVGALGVALGLVGLLAAANALGVRSILVYVSVGLVAWFFMHQSGVHATIAGVLVAMTVPARGRVDTAAFVEDGRALMDQFEEAGRTGASVVTNSEQQGCLHAIEAAAEHVNAPLVRLEHSLLPWVNFLILPVFALANAGLVFVGGHDAGVGETAGEIAKAPSEAVAAAGSLAPVWLGIVLGLVVGKPVGIVLGTLVALKLGIGSVSREINLRVLVGLGCLGGIGFTMALFIANLGFGHDPAALRAAKGAVLGASVLAAVIGWAAIYTCPGRARGGAEGGGA